MSDVDLKNYQLQLQQVEAALTSSADNEDLLKLKKDLEEVIELTKDLIGAQDTGATNESTDGATGSATPPSSQEWQMGDKCSAVWSKDPNTYYPAVIDEILPDGTCTVTFENYEDTTEITTVSMLRPYAESQRAQKRAAEDNTGATKKTKKDQLAAQREYKKKKNEKKRQRLKQLEEEKEVEKNKWLTFNAKTFSKTNKGRVKKSIFASPESTDGKVGVGTCGQSGQPMTAYHMNEKWKKSQNQ